MGLELSKKVAYIFEEGPNPSTDYYIIPLLSRKDVTIRRVSVHTGQFPKIEKGSYVFVVRYATGSLIKHIESYRDSIDKFVYFMDDGLWDLKALASVPLNYAWRLFKKAYIHKWSLLKLKPQVWVSTEYLREKYSRYNPKVVYPYPLGLEGLEISHCAQKVVFYHGTSSHKEEIEWLSDVFDALSQRFPDVLLEIVLNEKDWKKFRKIKNLVAFRPMGWDSFLRFSSVKYRKVGLAPLFLTEFNRGRSWVKFYDITRAGAVGIYSEHTPYSAYLKNFHVGLVLPMDKMEWVLAVEELLYNEKLRKELFNNAKNLVEYFRNLCLHTEL